MFTLCWLVIWCPGGKRFKFSRPCWLKREHILAIGQLFCRFLSWIFKLSILIVSEILSHAIYQFHIVRHPGPQTEMRNLCPTKICGWLTDWLKLTKESSNVQPWVRGRSTGSFPKQQLVIEPTFRADFYFLQDVCFQEIGKVKSKKGKVCIIIIIKAYTALIQTVLSALQFIN